MSAARRDLLEMFDQVSLGAPENAVGFVLWRLTHRFQRETERALRPLDLTHLQFTVLALTAWMGLHAPASAQADIARFGGVHPMQVSAVLKALERKRLVERSAVRGVAKAVAVTDKGLNALREALPLVRQVQLDLFGEDGAPGSALLRSLREVELRHGRDEDGA